MPNGHGLNSSYNRVDMRPLIFFWAFALSGCTASEEGFTLYRAELNGEAARFHVFTFDTSGGSEYNLNNCHLAAERFMKQQGDHYQFWCEKGPYRK